MEQKYCITIARQFGSLGRQIGKQLAKELDIAYYDRELLEHAAESMGLPVSSLADLDDKMSGTFQKMLYPLGISSSATQSKLFEVQKTMILDAANKSSCVIVGRAADYILKDYDNVVRIFIHAPQDYRIQRVMDVYGDTPKEARVNIERSDKARASYYEHISGTHWGDARNYELTVDSSDGVEKTAQFIVRYITGHTQTDSAV